jgi:hypothetical protein
MKSPVRCFHFPKGLLTLVSKGGALRLCSLITAFLFAALVFAAPVSAADNSSGENAVVRGGGLTCFSITPPDTPTNKPAPHTQATYRSCDELCAVKGAACTATTGTRNPLYACDTTDYIPGSSTLCRCCAVVR